MKISDFRANDQIQKFLATELTKLSGRGPIPRFVYTPKRGARKGGRGGRQLGSEELAKVRHSFIYGPTTSFKEPKTFFDNSGDGRYWEAFGIDGNEVATWPLALAEAAVALALNDQVRAQAKELESIDRSGIDREDLSRMSRYVVGLVGKRCGADGRWGLCFFRRADGKPGAFERSVWLSGSRIGQRWGPAMSGARFSQVQPCSRRTAFASIARRVLEELDSDV